MKAAHRKRGHNRVLYFSSAALPVIAGALLLFAFSRVPAEATAEEYPEFAVKAAFLFKFGAFVEWPESAFPSATSPATLCVVGDDPFGPTLDKAVDAQRIGTRPIVVRRMKTVGHEAGCQIAYVDGSDARRAAQSLQALRGESVLTITDGAVTPEATGIINFVVADRRVRFEIDDQAAASNQLTISSKLLGLARTAKRRE